MTDITELAQILKAAAEKAGIEQWVNNHGEVNTADYEVDGAVYIDHICNCEIVGTESPRAEYIAMANPANILSLVEALEKAQSKLDKVKSNSCHVYTSDEAFIPNSLDAWGRPVPQYLPYDFSGNPGASATQYCNGWNDAGGYWLNYVRELESRTVKLPKPHAHLIWIQAGHAPDDYWDDVAVSHREKDRCCDGSERYPVYARWEIEEMLTVAGIKWEVE